MNEDEIKNIGKNLNVQDNDTKSVLTRDNLKQLNEQNHTYEDEPYDEEHEEGEDEY